MDTELLQALGAEVAELMQALRLEIRRDLAADLALAQRAHAEEVGALQARQAETDHQLELTRAEVATLRAAAQDPVIAFSLDASGGVNLIQRHGPPRAVPLPDVAALVETLGEGLRASLAAEAHANVARAFELYCNAPAWSATTVYTAGEIVQTHVGRTYRVRAGVRATLGRVPGDDAEHWERLGSGGFRVLKTRPEALTPGDFFTEHDARFLHDGESTILFVPKAPKFSDVERAVKAPYGLAQSTEAEFRQHVARDAGLLDEVRRSTVAANDAGEIGAQALAQGEDLRRDLEALARRFEALTPGGAK